MLINFLKDRILLNLEYDLKSSQIKLTVSDDDPPKGIYKETSIILEDAVLVEAVNIKDGGEIINVTVEDEGENRIKIGLGIENDIGDNGALYILGKMEVR